MSAIVLAVVGALHAFKVLREVAPLGDEAAYGRALEALLRDPALRARLGADNAARARATYDEATMVATYDRLFSGD